MMMCSSPVKFERHRNGLAVRRPCARALRARVVALWAALWLPLVAIAQPTERQLALFTTNCAQCHAVPATGAPLMGRPADWQAAVAQGEDAMLVNVVQGIGGMPPLGYCSACTEADLRVLIRLLAGRSTDAGAAR